VALDRNAWRKRLDEKNDALKAQGSSHNSRYHVNNFKKGLCNLRRSGEERVLRKIGQKYLHGTNWDLKGT
jgi:hypothetical protein